MEKPRRGWGYSLLLHFLNRELERIHNVPSATLTHLHSPQALLYFSSPGTAYQSGEHSDISKGRGGKKKKKANENFSLVTLKLVENLLFAYLFLWTSFTWQKSKGRIGILGICHLASSSPLYHLIRKESFTLPWHRSTPCPPSPRPFSLLFQLLICPRRKHKTPEQGLTLVKKKSGLHF